MASTRRYGSTHGGKPGEGAGGDGGDGGRVALVLGETPPVKRAPLQLQPPHPDAESPLRRHRAAPATRKLQAVHRTLQLPAAHHKQQRQLNATNNNNRICYSTAMEELKRRNCWLKLSILPRGAMLWRHRAGKKYCGSHQPPMKNYKYAHGRRHERCYRNAVTIYCYNCQGGSLDSDQDWS